ncbi:MAG: YkgB family protein [Flavobacteriales bacterium]
MLKQEPLANMVNGMTVKAIGAIVLRYGLVIVLLWIGAMKFTEYEAKGIQPLVDHSPLLGWFYGIMSVPGFSKALGVLEIIIALMIGVRPWAPKLSALGSLLAVPMFLTTLTFLFSTPGWEPSLGGFPALSAAVGQFLIKDVVLLGAALWTLGEAWTASFAQRTPGHVGERITPLRG